MPTRRTSRWSNVTALSLMHSQCGTEDQRKAEALARMEFKVWIKKKLGLTFTHHEITVNVGDAGTVSGFGQHGIFLTHLLPYALPQADYANVLTLSYVRHDDFWHYRATYEAALTALTRISNSLLHPVFPLEWTHKIDVIRRLDAFDVPRTAWWTCENPLTEKRSRKIHQCGACKKCSEAGVQSTFAVKIPAKAKLKITKVTTLTSKTGDLRSLQIG